MSHTQFTKNGPIELKAQLAAEDGQLETLQSKSLEAGVGRIEGWN
jgi:hypothetical protein